jgi:protein phosphatase
MRASGRTSRGLVREANEDAFLRADDVRLFVVADGMGGHAAGEVASRLAVEAIEAEIRRTAGVQDVAWPIEVDARRSRDANRMLSALYLANERVFRAAARDQALAGMGTTVVGALLADAEDRVVIGHAGDSRLYLHADGELTLLTRDDSWLEMAFDNGLLGAVDALASHPNRHQLTNALGVRERAELHVEERPLSGRGVLLLCTDGLHAFVDHETMEAIVGEDEDLERVADRLVEAALDRGGRDNVTVLLVGFDAEAARRQVA